MSDGAALLNAILVQPGEDVPVLALADWLQENGAGGPATALRAAVALQRDPTVYLVSTGSYSDYSVRGVFSSKANADKFTATFGPRSDLNDLEEYTLDQGVSQLDAGLKVFHVEMLASGDGAVATPQSADSSPGWARLVDVSRNQQRLPGFRAYVWARDEQHAIKIANEKRVAHIAEESLGVKP